MSGEEPMAPEWEADVTCGRTGADSNSNSAEKRKCAFEPMVDYRPPSVGVPRLRSCCFTNETCAHRRGDDVASTCCLELSDDPKACPAHEDDVTSAAVSAASQRLRNVSRASPGAAEHMVDGVYHGTPGLTITRAGCEALIKQIARQSETPTEAAWLKPITDAAHRRRLTMQIMAEMQRMVGMLQRLGGCTVALYVRDKDDGVTHFASSDLPAAAPVNGPEVLVAVCEAHEAAIRSARTMMETMEATGETLPDDGNVRCFTGSHYEQLFGADTCAAKR